MFVSLVASFQRTTKTTLDSSQDDCENSRICRDSALFKFRPQRFFVVDDVFCKSSGTLEFDHSGSWSSFDFQSVADFSVACDQASGRFPNPSYNRFVLK